MEHAISKTVISAATSTNLSESLEDLLIGVEKFETLINNPHLIENISSTKDTHLIKALKICPNDFEPLKNGFCHNPYHRLCPKFKFPKEELKKIISKKCGVEWDKHLTHLYSEVLPFQCPLGTSIILKDDDLYCTDSLILSTLCQNLSSRLCKPNELQTGEWESSWSREKKIHFMEWCKLNKNLCLESTANLKKYSQSTNNTSLQRYNKQIQKVTLDIDNTIYYNKISKQKILNIIRNIENIPECLHFRLYPKDYKYIKHLKIKCGHIYPAKGDFYEVAELCPIGYEQKEKNCYFLSGNQELNIIIDKLGLYSDIDINNEIIVSNKSDIKAVDIISTELCPIIKPAFSNKERNSIIKNCNVVYKLIFQ